MCGARERCWVEEEAPTLYFAKFLKNSSYLPMKVLVYSTTVNWLTLVRIGNASLSA